LGAGGPDALPAGGPELSAAAAEALAAFVAESLKKARMEPCPAEILFDTDIVRYHEYYHTALSPRERRRRAMLEAEAFVAAGWLYEYEWYGGGEARQGMQASGLYGIESAFIRKFVKAMRAHRIKCVFAGSALVAYAGIVKYMLNALQATDAVIGKNIIAANIDDGVMKAVLFKNASIVHMEETVFGEGLEGGETLEIVAAELGRMAAQAYDRAGGGPRPDYVLLSGESAGGDGFDGQLAGRLNMPCRSFGDFGRMLERALAAGGELAGRGTLYPRIVAMAGMPPKSPKNQNLLFGGMRARKKKAYAALICGAVEILALLAMLALPAAGMYMEHKNEEGRIVIERQEYAPARDRLEGMRGLEALIQDGRAEDAYIKDSRGPAYGDVLREIGAQILEWADIEKIELVDGGRQLNVSVITDDIELLVTRANAIEGVYVNGASMSEGEGAAGRRCNITMTLAPGATGGSAAGDPAAEGSGR
jgi:hypothetical protein